MFQINCPNCGPRSVTEFRFGGELNARPQDASEEVWSGYLYTRENKLGVQSEWWYHRMGCQRWFIARRNTMNNEVLETHWPE